MNDRLVFIIKILLLSAALSVLIKYGGRFIPPIPPTVTNALIAVLTPTLVTAFALWWRERKNHPSLKQ